MSSYSLFFFNKELCYTESIKVKNKFMKNNTTKKILFVSRPIAPPWDEASKNFAYNLAKEITKIIQI